MEDKRNENESTNQENGSNSEMTRREFIESLGVGALAVGAALQTTGCKPKQEGDVVNVPIVDESINDLNIEEGLFPSDIEIIIKDIKQNPDKLTTEYGFPEDIANNLETYFVTNNPVLALEVARRLLEQKVIIDLARTTNEHYAEHKASGDYIPQYNYDPMVENSILGGTISIEYLGPMSMDTTDEFSVTSNQEVSKYGSNVAVNLEMPMDEIDDIDLVLNYALAFATRPILDIQIDYDNKTINLCGYRNREQSELDDDREL